VLGVSPPAEAGVRLDPEEGKDVEAPRYDAVQEAMDALPVARRVGQPPPCPNETAGPWRRCGVFEVGGMTCQG
jgi:hypothetical protein